MRTERVSRVVCFGEILLRLSPPGRELLAQSPRLTMWTGGAEANVATALARLGHRSAMVSAVPDNPLGAAAIATLRGHGVDCDGVVRAPGRMGLYFVTTGAGPRPTQVLYDRTGSSFALADAAAWDWPVVLAGADRLHLSGITPALGDRAAANAIAAASAAQAAGVPVSFDGNFRATLWAVRDVDPGEVLRPLVAVADLMFGDHRDIGLLLGRALPCDTPDQRRAAAEAAFAAFPNLTVIASTRRLVDDTDTHLLGARVDGRDDGVELPPLRLTGIVDRIGAGDAFVAGVLHAAAIGGALAELARTGLALSALKHSLPGDASLFGLADLAAFDTGLDVRR